MFGIGMTELLVIFVIGLLVLGPKRLPELARSLGKGLAEFRRASTDLRREFLDVADEVRLDRFSDNLPKSESESETKSETKSETEKATEEPPAAGRDEPSGSASG